MAVLPIVSYPDPRLAQAAAEVSDFDAGLERLAGDLLDTMRAAPGVGITAPHVGIARRVVVLELSAQDGVRVFVNPRLEWQSADRARHTEGSVSMPGATAEVERPASCRVSWRDLGGDPHEATFDGFLSVCLQHEIDQLDGVFWIDRLSRLKREMLVKRWTKERKRGGKG
ncbi:MAG: peptide deformylase [Hyphomicrobiaceae bacterium]|nr:peptide deformylase [Hyphomicrobiaceae bacterium]